MAAVVAECPEPAVAAAAVLETPTSHRRGPGGTPWAAEMAREGVKEAVVEVAEMVAKARAVARDWQKVETEADPPAAMEGRQGRSPSHAQCRARERGAACWPTSPPFADVGWLLILLLSHTPAAARIHRATKCGVNFRERAGEECC